MSATDRDRVETFIYKYWVALESWRYDDALTMLTEDVEYIALVTSQGKAAVSAALQKRGKTSVVRHLITNMIIDKSGAGFDISYLLTAFGKIVTPDEAGPFPSAAPENVADVEMTLVEVGGELKIKRLCGKPLFRAVH